MFRSVILARDEFGKLCDGFVDRVAGERSRIRVEVDGERIEGSELVDCTGRVGNEGRLPLRVGRDHGKVGEGDSDGEGVARNRDFVFVSDVKVFDLCEHRSSVSTAVSSFIRSAHLELQIARDLARQTLDEALVLLLFLRAHRRGGLGREEFGVLEFLHLGSLSPRGIFLGGRVGRVTGSREEVDIVDSNSHRL